jgi:hypothetical protein
MVLEAHLRLLDPCRVLFGRVLLAFDFDFDGDFDFDPHRIWIFTRYPEPPPERWEGKMKVSFPQANLASGEKGFVIIL